MTIYFLPGGVLLQVTAHSDYCVQRAL